MLYKTYQPALIQKGDKVPYIQYNYTLTHTFYLIDNFLRWYLYNFLLYYPSIKFGPQDTYE